jgi:hypothetical protein
VGRYEAQAASLHLPDDKTRQLRADMAEVEVQLGSPTPDHRIVPRAPSIGVRDP